MAKFVFGMNQSLDGYVDHDAMPAPDAALFQHWVDQVEALAGSLYGRRVYELMRYWDDEDPTWGQAEKAFATAWRHQPKWVVSSTLKSVGPNATLIAGDLEEKLRALKGSVEGEIDVAGPTLAHSVGGMGLIDEYRLYVRPFVLGGGKPFFHGAQPPLRLIATDHLGDAVRLSYVPA